MYSNLYCSDPEKRPLILATPIWVQVWLTGAGFRAYLSGSLAAITGLQLWETEV